MNTERRPHMRKPCPVKGCDWFLVTSWFIGGPMNHVPVSAKVQELQVVTHMVTEHGHSGPLSKIFT